MLSVVGVPLPTEVSKHYGDEVFVLCKAMGEF